MKVTVIGAGGQLGRALIDSFQDSAEVHGFAHEDLDVTCRRDVLGALETAGPDVVVNAAAMTDVDGCELKTAAAFAVNTLAVRWFAEACLISGARLVQISTDYVFSGDQEVPYQEWDPPGPLQVYGRSKLAGECEAISGCPGSLIVRTSWLYGGSERGFVQAVLRKLHAASTLRVVTDQRGSPSYTRDVAQAIAQMVQIGVTGVTHVTNGGSCSRYELAQEIAHCAGTGAVVEPVRTVDLQPSAARRPPNTALESLVCPAVGVVLRPWQEAIDEFVRAQD